MAGQDGSPIDTEEHFWDELSKALLSESSSHESIDDALRTWLHLVSTCRDYYLPSEDDVASCSQKLIDSRIFRQNKQYVRTQIIYSLLQEDELLPLHAITNFLLLDGRSDEDTFRHMIDAGCFPRLLELVKCRREEDRRFHRLLLELMYEMSRLEHLRQEDLAQVDDSFVTYLFQLVEILSDDANDPYHYPIIRVLMLNKELPIQLVLNEQYMVTSTTADPNSTTSPPTNRVMKILSLHGPSFRTFGENLILLLNRETETALQLLILKLLYLLFTTKSTYEYFYTNDLRVLLDVIIRNLLDLPDELMSLRHTYLRVLSPLLAHTQLSHPPHYKREEILKVLGVLSGSGNAHFAPADDTTLRLVDRVAKVSWLVPEEKPGSERGEHIANKFLGISLSHSQTNSSVSVVDVAAVTEKPGVQTPSRNTEFAPELKDQNTSAPSSPEADVEGRLDGERAAPSRFKKPLPVVPKHRHGLPVPPPLVAGPGAGAGTGDGSTPKKLPPKVPPPRRKARVKATATIPNVGEAVASETLSHQVP